MAYPLPALDVRPPQQPDILDKYAKLSNLAMTQKLGTAELQGRTLENQIRQNQLETTQSVNKAYQDALTVDPQGNPQIDTGALQKSLAANGHGAAIPEILKGVNEYQKGNAEVQKLHGELTTQSQDLMGSLGYAIQQSKYDPNLADLILQHGMASAKGNPQAQQQLQALEAQIKQNPETIKSLADQWVLSSPKQQELLNQRKTAEARGGPDLATYNELTANGMSAEDALAKVEELKKKGSASDSSAAAQATVGKIAAAGLNTTPARLTQSIETAHQKQIISDEEYASLKGYQAIKGSESGKLQLNLTEAAVKENMRRADKAYGYTDPSKPDEIQWAMGDKVPKDADAVFPIKDLQSERKAGEALSIVQQSFNQLAGKNQKIFDDPRARVVLTTALDDAKARTMGILIAGTGGSLTMPSGSGHIIDQLLENHAVPEKLRKDVKEYIVANYAMKDKVMALQMALQGGKIGRGAMATIQPMYNQIPGVITADSKMANDQLRTLQTFISGAKGNFPKDYGSFHMPDDYEFKGEQAAPPPAKKSWGDQFPDHTDNK